MKKLLLVLASTLFVFIGSAFGYSSIVEQYGSMIVDRLENKDQAFIDLVMNKLNAAIDKVSRLSLNKNSGRVQDTLQILQNIKQYIHEQWYSLHDNMHRYINQEHWIKLLVPKKTGLVSDTENDLKDIVISSFDEGIWIAYAWDDHSSLMNEDFLWWRLIIQDIENNDFQPFLDTYLPAWCDFEYLEDRHDSLYARIVVDWHISTRWVWNCMLNFMHTLMYDEVTQKALYRTHGHDVNFGYRTNEQESHYSHFPQSYDSTMIGSIRFFE